MSRKLVWFSCGAASAVLVKKAVEEYGKDGCQIVTCDTRDDEHPDNARFLKDVETWADVEVVNLKSAKYNDCDDVFRTTRYMSGVDGARCTAELKKKVREAYQTPSDLHLFGFTADEKKRCKDFEFNAPELSVRWLLVELGTTKSDCFNILQSAGIELPKMYTMGYRNNNCLGCVKSSSPGYWSKIRKDFPERFAMISETSRDIGCRLIEATKPVKQALGLEGRRPRIFLDELPPGEFPYKGEDLSCGVVCQYE